MTTDGSAREAPLDWERRVDALWLAMDAHSEDELLAAMDRLASELPADHPAGLFERASALDSTGHSDLAIPLYQRALALGLSEVRRRRAVIQLASSLRNLGRITDSVDLLTAERKRTSDTLDDAVDAFLALALVDSGQERHAVSLALTALARHLPLYRRSVVNYARAINPPRAGADGVTAAAPGD